MGAINPELPMTPSAAPRPRPAPRVSLRRIVVPTEHGAWGFLAEPVALGLLAAFSAPGVLAALATGSVFLARQPLKLAAADRAKGKRYPRTVIAERAAAALALLGGLCLAGALLLAGPRLLLPLAVAGPLGALTLAYDLRHRSRTWIAELAAPVALTSTVAVLALAAGWALAPALGLWGLLAARAVPSVLYVRARLRLERGEDPPRAVAEAAQGFGFLAALALAATGLAPWLGTAAVGVLTVRAFWGLSSFRRPATARRVGVSEIFWGTFLVLATAAGIALGL